MRQQGVTLAALYSKTQNLDIECDGDKYHKQPDQILYDKRRDNILTNSGWAVLRYTTHELVEDFQKSWSQITSTITRFGGIQHQESLDKYIYPRDPRGQGRLWD